MTTSCEGYWKKASGPDSAIVDVTCSNPSPYCTSFPSSLLHPPYLLPTPKPKQIQTNDLPPSNLPPRVRPNHRSLNAQQLRNRHHSFLPSNHPTQLPAEIELVVACSVQPLCSRRNILGSLDCGGFGSLWHRNCVDEVFWGWGSLL
jgi:hypothetical protein